MQNGIDQKKFHDVMDIMVVNIGQHYFHNGNLSEGKTLFYIVSQQMVLVVILRYVLKKISLVILRK